MDRRRSAAASKNPRVGEVRLVRGSERYPGSESLGQSLSSGGCGLVWQGMDFYTDRQGLAL